MQFSGIRPQVDLVSQKQKERQQQMHQKGLHYLVSQCKLMLQQAQFFIIDNDTDILEQKSYSIKRKKIVIMDCCQGAQRYQRVGQFSLDQQNNIIYFKLYLLLNGTLVSLQQDMRQKMYLRLQSKINASSTAFSLVICPTSKNIYFQNKQLINATYKQIFLYRPRQMTTFSEFIVSSIIKFRKQFKIILYLKKQVQAKGLLNIHGLKNLFTCIIKYEQQLLKLQRSLFQSRIKCNFNQQQALIQQQQQYRQFNINNNEKIQKTKQQKISTNQLNSAQTQQFTQKLAVNTAKKVELSATIHKYTLKQYNYFIRDVQNALQIIKHGSSLIHLNLSDNLLIESSNIDKIQKQNKRLSKQISQEINNKVFQNIQIITPMIKIEWKSLTKGGYGFLEVAQVKFKINEIDQQSNKQIIVGTLVRKCDKNKRCGDKIQHEKKVLSLLSQVQSINIKTYFESKQPQYNAYIFSKYQPFHSLDIYACRNTQTFSLSQKLILLVHACNGIRILHQNKIIHLDIKPGNIIVTQDLVGKVIDFGQAYIVGQDPTKYNYGRTVPYAAPQVYGRNSDFTYKADVYSIGVMIFKVIFGEHIFAIRDKNQFQIDLIEDKVRIIIVPQAYAPLDHDRVNRILIYLCLMCIQRNPEKRPSLDWVLTILIQVHSFVSKVYS